MYRFAKNGKNATLADLLIIGNYNYDLCIADKNKDSIDTCIFTDLSSGYELVWHPNIYSNKPDKTTHKRTLILPSNESVLSPAREITYNNIIYSADKSTYIPILTNTAVTSASKQKIDYYGRDDVSINKMNFLYRTIGSNFIINDYLYNTKDSSFKNIIDNYKQYSPDSLSTYGNALYTYKQYIANSSFYLKNFEIKVISTSSNYSNNDSVKRADIFPKSKIIGIEIVDASQDYETALEANYSGDVSITWSGHIKLLYNTGDSSLITISKQPYTLTGVKPLSTIIWPELGNDTDIDGSVAYDLCEYDNTLLGINNDGREYLDSSELYAYFSIDNSNNFIEDRLYPYDCIRNFTDIDYSKYTTDKVTIIANTLHLLRKANFIYTSLYYNILMHLEIYLGGVNYSIYPTMGYGLKIGDTTLQSLQNARLIPWQGETIYLLTYFTYAGDQYVYKSGATKNVLFNEVNKYEFNILYHYIQDLTQVHFYSSLSSEAVSYANVNTPSILIPLNTQMLERTLTLSVVYVYDGEPSLLQGTTTSIEFRQEANPNIDVNDHLVTVYAIASDLNPSEDTVVNAKASLWDWSARLRITMNDPNESTTENYSEDETLYSAPAININEDILSLTLNDLLSDTAPSVYGDGTILDESYNYYDTSSNLSYKTFYVSANTTADNSEKYPAKYICGIITNNNASTNTTYEANTWTYPSDLEFTIEENALTFSAIQNTYYFTYSTVEGDNYSHLLLSPTDVTYDDENTPNNSFNMSNWTDKGNSNTYIGLNATLTLSYDSTLKGYKLYVLPLYRPFKYLLNISFQKDINTNNRYYYIIKFKVTYVEYDSTYTTREKYQMANTDLLKGDNGNFSNENPQEITDNNYTTGNDTYDTIIKNTAGIHDNFVTAWKEDEEKDDEDLEDEVSDTYVINSYMPIDVDDKVYFKKTVIKEETVEDDSESDDDDEGDESGTEESTVSTTTSTTATSKITNYTYMFVCNSNNLKEYKGIPIYGIYQDPTYAYNYEEMIAMPKQINVNIEYEILWYAKGTTDYVDPNQYDYSTTILYSTDNINYNSIETNQTITLDYTNQTSTDYTTPIDTLNIYIKNSDSPVLKGTETTTT